MRFLDTNIFVRYLTRDDKTKALACYELFQRVQRGQESLITCEAVIAEVVYVLSSRNLYGLTHQEIRDRLVPVLSLPGLKLPQKGVYLRALDLFATFPALDMEDAVVAAHMANLGIREIVSYDTDFDDIPGIRRFEP